jgi:hypothetical protein
MSAGAMYRRHAADCLRLAQLTSAPQDKTALAEMAACGCDWRNSPKAPASRCQMAMKRNAANSDAGLDLLPFARNDSAGFLV